jgi:hypothetical protein
MKPMDESEQYFFLRKPGILWRWEAGLVDEAGEHILLSFGDIHNVPAADMITVGRLSPPQGQVFTVEWLIEADTPEHAAALDAGRRALDFYLVELQKQDAWQYAIYHCSTMSNIYSSVHWSYFPEGVKGGINPCLSPCKPLRG